MDELDLRIRNHVYASFMRDGVAQTPEVSAAALALDEETVAESYRRLHDSHALVLDPDGTEIRMLNPFSAVETPHRVEAGGREWFANCAWDALGIAAMLDTEVEVSTRCPDCSEPIELRVGAASEWPEHAVIHFALPPARWWDDIAFT